MDKLGDLAEGRVIVARGDITAFEGDAIVNAANSSLLGGGGVDGAIHRAGGPAILDACRAIRSAEWPDGLPTGKAVATGGGRLSAKAVIHTVGPVWCGGSKGEAELLASCYRESLEIAASEGFATIAFPAISTGVYGYPKKEAARIAFRTVMSFLEGNAVPKTVWLVFYSEADARVFLKTVKEA